MRTLLSKTKLLVVINSRANYGRIKSVLYAAKHHPNIELIIVVGASAVLSKFGDVCDIISQDGFDIADKVYSIVEGESLVSMAKSTGLGIIELTSVFERLRPDVVLTVADRFETLATAVASSYMNIPLAHTQGGEVTGSIDESVRHAITKLAHIHFPATARARDFILRMGEDPNNVVLTGCPAIDLLTSVSDYDIKRALCQEGRGVGTPIDPNQPYIVVVQHPVTTEFGAGAAQIKQTLAAVEKVNRQGMQVVWLWPNVDAGSDDISKVLRQFRENSEPNGFHFYRNFPPEYYAAVINSSKCIVGNSSSGIREASFLGLPSVNIGNRQSDREHAENCITVSYDASDIFDAISYQIGRRYPVSTMFGDGCAGKRIVDAIADRSISVVKRLSYLDTAMEVTE